jgi:hypothetical protein
MSAIAQRSFAGGELSPAMYAHTDQTKYASGLRTLRNMFVRRHGGVANRPGTEFIGEVKDSSKVVILRKFVLSDSQTYVLEFGEGYIRFFKNGARLNVSGVAAWSNATNYVIGDLVVQGGVNYYCVLAHINQVPPNAGYWYPLTGTIYEIPSAYFAPDLAAIRFAQSTDTITLVHPSYAVRELKRSAETTWTLSKVTFGPALPAPTGFGTAGGAAGAVLYWLVSAINDETFEEGPAAGGNAVNRVPSAGTPTTISWTAVSGATRYNIYRSTDGASYGYIGSASGVSFSDIATAPDYTHPPQNATRDPFANTVTPESATGKHPVAVGFYQQRRIFANNAPNPETVWGSKSGLRNNFGTSYPIQADDAVTFTLVGRKANPIMHLLDLGALVIFTTAEEKLVEGDQSGILRPDAINPRKISSNGSGTLRPLEVGDSAIYLQARGSLVRDLTPLSADSYEGTDLTVFASHLFEGFSIVDWDFSLNPNSIVWAIRSDGELLGLTYMRDQSIWGWHHHDTDGTFENVCVVPEGSEDRVYLVVKRTIGGVTKRYVERMASRFYADPEDAFFVDCGLSYDGWNTGATTMTLSGGSSWDETELLTLTASAGAFAAGDVGNQVFLPYVDADGNDALLRLRIDSYTSATVVKGFADKTVPASLRAIATTNWALAKKTMSGLSHLEGKSLSVLGDGYVVASPNNEAYDLATVTAGVITLPEPHAVIHAGLPFISDFEPLELDAAGAATIKNQKLLVNRVGLYLERSRGIWIGPPDGPTDDDPLAELQEWKARDEENYSSPTDERTAFIDVQVESRWGNGRFLVRQVDPVPVAILSATPIGYLPT